MNKMENIEIKKTTYKRLKSKITEFGETVDTVINKVLDQLEETPPPPHPEPDNDDIIDDPYKLPNLYHTKVLSATIDGNGVSILHWNSIRNELISIAFQRGKDIDWLRKRSLGDIVEGIIAPDHYRYLPGCDISVVQTSAQNAGHTLMNIARDLSIEVGIEFKWRNKKGAARPGETAVLWIDEGEVTVS